MSRAPEQRPDHGDDPDDRPPAVVKNLIDRVDVLEDQVASTRQTVKDQVARINALEEDSNGGENQDVTER